MKSKTRKPVANNRLSAGSMAIGKYDDGRFWITNERGNILEVNEQSVETILRNFFRLMHPSS